jgi:hypothetical protein
MPATSRAQRRKPQPARQFLRPQDLRCLLCDREPAVQGVFVPRDQDGVGAPTGKLRAAVYALCRRCRGKPGVLRLVDRTLMRELRTLTTPAGVN